MSNILLFDDERVTLVGMSAPFKDTKYTTLSYTSLDDAINHAHEADYAIVDWELTNAVRGLHDTRELILGCLLQHIPVMIRSTHDFMDIMQNILAYLKENQALELSEMLDIPRVESAKGVGIVKDFELFRNRLRKGIRVEKE